MAAFAPGFLDLADQGFVPLCEFTAAGIINPLSK
jgi:hypothetical protein